MKFIKCTKEQVILQCEKNEVWRESFAFDLSIIPDSPIPKKIVIESPRGAKSWSMAWKKFLKQECVGNIVILHKDNFDQIVNKA